MTDDDAFQKVHALINRYDPEDLLDIAPDDEYDLEVGAFLDLVRSQEKITSETVSAIWLRYFGASDWPTERPAEPAKVAAELEAIRRNLHG